MSGTSFDRMKKKPELPILSEVANGKCAKNLKSFPYPFNSYFLLINNFKLY